MRVSGLASCGVAVAKLGRNAIEPPSGSPGGGNRVFGWADGTDEKKALEYRRLFATQSAHRGSDPPGTIPTRKQPQRETEG